MNLHYAGLGMDYMMSLYHIGKRIQPRPCDRCCSFVGVTTGLVRRYGKFRAVPDWMPVQVKLKVASSLYLYAEPKVGIRTDTYDGSGTGKT